MPANNPDDNCRSQDLPNHPNEDKVCSSLIYEDFESSLLPNQKNESHPVVHYKNVNPFPYVP